MQKIGSLVQRELLSVSETEGLLPKVYLILLLKT